MSTDKHYILTTPKYKFYVTVSESNMQYYTDYTIYVGGSKKGCVIINVSSPPSNTRFSFVNHTIAKIHRVDYDERCAISTSNTNGLEHGEGTRYMVLIALSFVKHQFPYISQFKLTDASTIQCSDYTVSLPHLYVALHGKTWYEKHFKAYMLYEEIRKLYDFNKAKFTDPKAKKPIDEFLYMYPVPSNSLDIFKSTYKSCNTYVEVFNQLRQIDNENKTQILCEIFSDWVIRFVNSELGGSHINQHEWIITDLSYLLDMSKYKIENIQNAPNYLELKKGGNRYARLPLTGLPSQNLGLDWRDL